VVAISKEKNKNPVDSAVPPDSSLHSNEIKENLDSVNMDPWYYIYENYVNPDLKKRKTD